MQQVRFLLPTKILFGAGTLNQLGKEANKLGKKAILVTGSSSMRKTGVLDKVVKDLNANGVTTVVFDRVESNPRAATVDEGIKLARQEQVDLVIGLGGGSAMDAAKSIAVASSGTAPVWDYFSGKAEPKGALPILLVPTVAATGSESNNSAVVTNWETHDKKGIAGRFMQARVSIVDPQLTLTVPAKPTAQGGVDIFCHVVEQYLTTSDPSDVTDGIVETVMRVSVQYLPRVLAKLDDLKARTELSWASTIARSNLAQLGGGIEAGYLTLHEIEHAVSGYYDIAHGDGLATLMPAWMKYTYPVRKERFAQLAKNVFGKKDGIAATEDWLKKVGMSHRLRDFNVNPKDFEKMADSAIRTGYFLDKHPRKLDIPAIVQIYQESY